MPLIEQKLVLLHLIKILAHERDKLVAIEAQYKQQYKDAFELYTNGASSEHAKQGRVIPQHIIVKKDAELYVESDPLVIQAKIKLAIQQEKISTLLEIVRMINNRSYQIRGVIDWEKFKAGL